MDFTELIKTRQSVRSFQNKKIDKEALENLLKLTNRAPSAGNLQAYEIYIIDKEDLKKELSHAAMDQASLIEASVILIFCANSSRNTKYGDRGASLYSIQDATIATAYAQLAVTNAGLSSVWVGAFEPENVRNILDLPDGIIPVSMLPIGYSNETPDIKSRRELEDIMHYL